MLVRNCYVAYNASERHLLHCSLHTCCGQAVRGTRQSMEDLNNVHCALCAGAVPAFTESTGMHTCMGGGWMPNELGLGAIHIHGQASLVHGAIRHRS